MPLERITITIPHDVLLAADRRAKAEDRSRSWVIADVLRRGLSDSARGTRLAQPPASGDARYPALPAAHLAVAEPAAAAYAAFEEARHHHLLADLALTPAERLERAQSLADLAQHARPRAPRKQVVAFDSLDDFATWKAARRIGA